MQFDINPPNMSFDVEEYKSQLAEYRRQLELKITRLNENRTSEAKALDKSLISLSAGSLALSVTFIHTVIVGDGAVFIDLLFISWFFFVLCIYSALIGFYKSIVLHDHALEYLEMHGNDDLDTEKIDKKMIQRDRLQILVQYLNLVSLGSFLIGGICLIIFAGANIHERESLFMGKDTQRGITVSISDVKPGTSSPLSPTDKNPPPKPPKK